MWIDLFPNGESVLYHAVVVLLDEGFEETFVLLGCLVGAESVTIEGESGALILQLVVVAGVGDMIGIGLRQEVMPVGEDGVGESEESQ